MKSSNITLQNAVNNNNHKIPVKTSIHSISLLALAHRAGLSRLLFHTFKSGFKVPKYQNTYRLESYNPFNAHVVDKILSEVMHRYLINIKYHPQVCMQICQQISREVRNQIDKKSYDRYKFVVLITIVQNLGQQMYVKFAKLCDAQRDTYSTHVIETSEFIAFGLVVGMYYE